jgi:hypothetical protein
MHIPPTRSTDERGHQERISAILDQHIDIAAFAGLAPSIRAKEPRAATEPIGPGALEGRAYAGHNGRASYLCLPALFRDLFLEVRPYRATESAHELGIWQSRSHGQRMAPGITHGKSGVVGSQDLAARGP